MIFDFDATIFDMDGTLLDTMPYWRFTSLEYLLAHRLPVFPDMLAAMFSTSSRKLIQDNAERLGIHDLDFMDMVHEMEGFMNRHYLYDAQLKDPLVPAFLETLEAKGIRRCVATGSPRQYARNGLKRLGLLQYFEFVTDNYETPLAKHQPEYFTELAKRLGVVPAGCVVFEDALYAMRSAHDAGMRVCAIEDATQASDWPEIRKLADWTVKSYSELL